MQELLEVLDILLLVFIVVVFASAIAEIRDLAWLQSIVDWFKENG